MLERKVWVRTKGSDLYPNLYLILVGPPGIGKSAVLAQAERIIRTIPEIHVAPSSVSAASLIDSLAEATQKKIQAGMHYVEYNSLSVIASEFGVFLSAYEHAFMNLLTKAYDGEFIEDKKRGNKIHIKIKNPLLSIAAGTTPSYLNSVLPEGAWDQGFTSRTIFIYSGESMLSPLFDNSTQHDKFEKVYNNLLADIKIIASLYGKFSWHDTAATAITNWHMAKGPPIPEHTKLTYYVTRRTAHLLKLCMVASVDRGNDMTITIDDYQRALGWLLEAETYMPDIFRAMATSGDSAHIEECFHFVEAVWVKEEKPIPEHRIVDFLSQRVPGHSVMKILDIMIRSRFLDLVDYGGPQGRPRYKPIRRNARF